jgi:ABC-type nitrate/sulfonate/bicarbonate transport system substrate-binding protein
MQQLMRSLRTFAAGAAVAALAASIPAVAQTKLKVAEGSRSFTVMPLYIAMDAGYLKEQGIEIELITMKGGPAAVGALMSGDVDLTFSTVETPIKMRSQGKDLRVIALMQDKNPCVLVVPSGSTIKSLAELKGKTIGVTATGSLTDLVLRSYINRLGMNASDFEIVGLGSGATVAAALERGQVQAAIAVTPFLTRLQMDNKVKIIHDFRKEVYPGQAVLVRGQDLGGPKERVQRKFVAALAKASKTLHEDRALTTRIGRTYFPDMDPKVLEAMILDETQTTPIFSRDVGLTRGDYDVLTDLLMKNKLITKAEKYDDIVVEMWR